jgi:hypothetical protein
MLTSEQYVTEKAWLQASLKQCPSHPGGGCRFSRHGSYPRMEPPGMRVARYYCREAHKTFSLLPDCLSCRLTGSLDEAEQVVIEVEESHSLEAAASAVRPDLSLPGAIRWVQRRRQGVRAALLALITLLPGRLGTTAELRSVRRTLGTERALVALREIAATQLSALPRPLGFRPARLRRSQTEHRLQHKTGADPPRRLRY